MRIFVAIAEEVGAILALALLLFAVFVWGMGLMVN